MIAKITKGERVQGLLLYLFGPGRSEEHTDPHLVAGWEGLLAEQGRLSTAEVFALAADMDGPRATHEVSMSGGYVWQCSLRNHADDRVLTDQEWARIARDAIAALGFDQCRWVAVRHAGDHIHLAVTRVSEQGKVVSIWNDRRVMSRVAARWEVAFELGQRTSRGSGAGMPGLSRAEIDRAARTGKEPDRTGLERKLRAAAAVARTEGEFVARARSGGLMVEPRRSPDGQQVVGYKVADPNADRMLWHGGAGLAPDLSLPRLRRRWEPHTDQAARAHATGEWSTTGSEGGRVGAGSRLRAEAWEAADAVVRDVHTRMRAIPAGDRQAWAAAAGEVAGVLSVLAVRAEGERPGQLSAAARAMTRSAQSATGTVEPYPEALHTMWGPARVAADAALLTYGSRTAVAVLMRSLHDLMATIERAHQLQERLGQARQVTQARVALQQWMREPVLPLGVGVSAARASTSVRGGGDPGREYGRAVEQDHER
jgi:hypothetical protein